MKRTRPADDDAGTAWREPLEALALALADTCGPSLVEAQKGLSEILSDVTKRVRLQGGDPLLEKMVQAAQKTVRDSSKEDLRKLLTTLTAQVHVAFEEAGSDIGSNTVEVGAEGNWSVCGKSYVFAANVSDAEGDQTGRVEVEGLGFFVADELKGGDFDGHDARDWASAAGVAMADPDVIRAVVAGLEVLMKKKQTGCGTNYGIDVLDIAFKVLRKAAKKLKKEPVVEAQKLFENAGADGSSGER